MRQTETFYLKVVLQLSCSRSVQQIIDTKMDPIESTVDIEAYDRLGNVLHSPAAYNGYDRSASCEEEEESFQDDFTKTKDSLLEKQRSRNTSSAPNVGIVYDLAEQKGDHSQQVNGDSAALVKETEVGDAENVVQLQTDIFSMFFLSPILSSSSLYTIVSKSRLSYPYSSSCSSIIVTSTDSQECLRFEYQ